MTTEKQQPKFCVGQKVRAQSDNSLSPIYEVLKVFWHKSPELFMYPSCYKYVISNIDNPEEVHTRKEYEIKSSDELCPYEVYGNKMVGKKVSHVDFTSDKLTIHFEDGYVSNFTADCSQNYGYIDFEGDK